MSLRPVARRALVAATMLVALSILTPAFAADPAPRITSLSPNSVFTIGDDLVTIAGENLDLVTGVLVDGVDIPFQLEDDGTITFFSPAHQGVAQVRLRWAGGVTADNGTADDLTYETVCAPPVITSITPSAGPTTGGTSVTIKGQELVGTTGVVFGSDALVTNLHVVSNNELTVTSPAVAGAGTLPVLVLNRCGASADNGASRFTYTAAPVLLRPVILGMTPSWGVAGFGGVTSIAVQDPGAVTSVKFGTVPATKYWYSSKQVLAIAPPQPKGQVSVRITNAAGTSVSSAKSVYRYLGR